MKFKFSARGKSLRFRVALVLGGLGVTGLGVWADCVSFRLSWVVMVLLVNVGLLMIASAGFLDWLGLFAGHVGVSRDEGSHFVFRGGVGGGDID